MKKYRFKFAGFMVFCFPVMCLLASVMAFMAVSKVLSGYGNSAIAEYEALAQKVARVPYVDAYAIMLSGILWIWLTYEVGQRF